MEEKMKRANKDADEEDAKCKCLDDCKKRTTCEEEDEDEEEEEKEEEEEGDC